MVTQVTPLATIMLGMIVKRLIIKITMMVTLQLVKEKAEIQINTTSTATANTATATTATANTATATKATATTARLTPAAPHHRLTPLRHSPQADTQSSAIPLKLTPPRQSPPKQTLSLLSKLWTKITHKRFLK